MKLPAEAENDDGAQYGLDPNARIVIEKHPRQLDIEHRQCRRRDGKREGEECPLPRPLQVSPRLFLVITGEFGFEDLVAVLDDHVIERADR